MHRYHRIPLLIGEVLETRNVDYPGIIDQDMNAIVCVEGSSNDRWSIGNRVRVLNRFSARCGDLLNDSFRSLGVQVVNDYVGSKLCIRKSI